MLEQYLRPLTRFFKWSFQLISVGIIHSAAAYTGLLVASINRSAIDVINHLTSQAKSNPCLVASEEVGQQFRQQCTRFGKDFEVIPLREAYLKVSKVVAGINKHLGFNLAVQLLHHGMMLVIFVVIITDTPQLSSSSAFRVWQGFSMLAIHAAVVFRVLSVAERLTEKVRL
jgi:hypothetical protein